MLSRLLRPAALAVLALAAYALPSGAAEESATATVAHIKLSGSLGEAPVAEDPLFGALSENFQKKLDRIKKAKTDSAVQGLFLQIEGVGVGWGKLEELRRAVADFRKSGKKAFAYVEAGDAKDYLLALACDEVCVPECGWLMLTGLRAEVSFYKDMFDKLGVKADMLQMGDFKGAAEPYTRSGMSPEFRKQFESVLDDFYEKDLVERIVQSRPGKDWNAEQVKKLIDGGPYTAKAALKAGLIDRVAYSDSFQDDFKTALKAERAKVVKNYGGAESQNIDFSNPFAILKLLATPKTTSSTKPKIAVVYATGVIMTGKSTLSLLGGETCGSTTMVEAIRQAEQDKTVKAIVLRVDSPGGSALASDLIWHELKKCKKPVVASMSDTAASGGYYISMGCQKIFAEPGTLTGSVGVVGGKLALGGLYDKVGLKTEVISRGANANLLSMTTPFSESERAVWAALMKDIYDQFLTKALEGRKAAGKEMTREQLEKLAGGRIWTGRQAKENGLIDEVGTLDDAIGAAKKLAKMADDAEVELLPLPKAKSFLDQLVESRGEARLPLLRQVPELSGNLGTLEALLHLRGEPVWALMPCRIDVR